MRGAACANSFVLQVTLFSPVKGIHHKPFPAAEGCIGGRHLIRMQAAGMHGLLLAPGTAEPAPPGT